ncbi:adenosine kinase [Dermatobacter hominis]|uniref:adenosine kinase n=1 Tax=Dermatobacter hominis TaxID=2884263 RepID=UPI001D104EF1|nr:adenosine kinase [Dermatobacter hominis]UDY37718.1 adenosine kinase [Dermatobacter hominis]
MPATNAPTIDVNPGELDVVGIGNALVDVLSHGSDELVAELGLVKGSMNLIESERVELLYERMGPGVEVSGGSAANTMAGLASLGGTAQYLGKVRDDQLGAVFAHDLAATGVRYSTARATAGPSTGCCLILVTPDAQRTMNTYLGASVHFGPDDVDEAAVASATVLYLEGYLFDPPEAQEAFRRAARIAHDAGRTVSITLSDSFCVERHRDAFLDLVEHHVDLLFANEAEITTLYQSDFDSAVEGVRRHGAVAALTRSEKGSVIVTEDALVEVPAHPVEQLVDTTGAGDLYASGFLYGFSHKMDLATCGALGSLAAAEVISHMGPRPETDLSVLAREILSA